MTGLKLSVVPQGTVLGPLFNLYINDKQKRISHEITLMQNYINWHQLKLVT